MSAEDWIRHRLASAPPRLLELMVEAVRPIEASDLPDTLARAATSLYAAVIEGSGGREDALPLLAADALFTHAFQAAAELNPDGLSEFAVRWSGGNGLAGLIGDA